MLIVTFDEGTCRRGVAGSGGGGHVATVVVGPGVLSIFLRQRGSPESKPVAAPHAQTRTS